jgi:hypothetical protein
MIYMVKGPDTLGEYVTTLFENGMTRTEIETHLLDNGHDEQFVKELVSETVKLRDTKRRSQGLILILVGALICFTSFLLTITSTYTQGNFSLVLYGLTSLGIIIVFTGLMKIF